MSSRRKGRRSARLDDSDLEKSEKEEPRRSRRVANSDSEGEGGAMGKPPRHGAREERKKRKNKKDRSASDEDIDDAGSQARSRIRDKKSKRRKARSRNPSSNDEERLDDNTSIKELMKVIDSKGSGRKLTRFFYFLHDFSLLLFETCFIFHI